MARCSGFSAYSNSGCHCTANTEPSAFSTASTTPSIARAQQSVNLQSVTREKLAITGRHDPCIVPRAVPCVEAAAAVAVYDALLARRKETR